MENEKETLFIFRRDLRFEDNTALIEALKDSSKVLPVFLLNPLQVKNNPYKSDNAIKFMFESLNDLDKQLKEKNSGLNIIYGNPLEELKKLLETKRFSKIYFNKDYTPYSLKRDKEIEKLGKELNIEVKSFDDVLLNSPESIKKEDGKPYSIFTAYYNKALKLKIKEPQKNKFKNFSKPLNKINWKDIESKLSLKISKKIYLKGGSSEANKILSNTKDYQNYTSERDFPELKKTTHLSPYLKFGCISPRQLYKEIKENLGKEHPLVRQLYWRDFYYMIAYNFPEVFGNSFQKKFDKIKWENKKDHLEAWKNGKTGFPIVDAGMRELNETGFMHNRVRMIVASFLTKDLHIDWRIGEKYFAQKLIDYDPCINNGNWQWAASTGCDPQPFFRIFNPWLQQKKFDPNTKYIKKWVPELSDLTPKEIHNLENNPKENLNYPIPIINHKEESKKSKETYRSC